MTRLFVAIKIDEGLKEKILEIEKQFSGLGKINFVGRENLHLTLKFLGEQGEGRNRFPDQSNRNLFQPAHNSVKEMSERIKSVAGKIQPFRISISGLSFFGSPNSIRIIFLEVKNGKERVVDMERELNEKLKNFREDDFDPHPHLTIGRVGFVKDTEKLLGKINSLKDVFVGEMDVKEIFLMKSEFKGTKATPSLSTSRGPVYSEVERFGLK